MKRLEKMNGDDNVFKHYILMHSLQMIMCIIVPIIRVIVIYFY